MPTKLHLGLLSFLLRFLILHYVLFLYFHQTNLLSLLFETDFDFEQFLQGDAFSFDAAAFDPEGIEATGMGDA